MRHSPDVFLHPEQFLGKIASQRRQAYNYACRLIDMQMLSESASNPYAHIQTACTNKSAESSDAVGAVSDLSLALDALTIQNTKAIHDAARVISRIPNATFQMILTLHYLKGFTFRQMVRELPFTIEKLKSLHVAALEAFKESARSEEGVVEYCIRLFSTHLAQ